MLKGLKSWFCCIGKASTALLVYLLAISIDNQVTTIDIKQKQDIHSEMCCCFTEQQQGTSKVFIDILELQLVKVGQIHALVSI